MIESLRLPAPAKLNLMLHIVGRRADGYHELESVIQFVDYCDELEFSARSDGRINLQNNLEGISVEHNLIYRAAVLLQQHTGCRQGVDIRCHKIIPQAAGLGGGSSDAATTLHGLNQLWQLQLSLAELLALAPTLGADVPLFTLGQAAWMEGIGEKLSPITLREPWYVVLVPPVAINTAKTYADPELTRNSSRSTIRALTENSRNDFQALVVRRYPEVAAVIDWLAQFAKASLTGSGCAVFAEVADKAAAQQILAKLPKQWFGFCARGLNQSPLLARLMEYSVSI